MLFNSIEFAYFLPIVLLIYWLMRSQTASQNVFLTLASYFFYGWWDWRFLSLIIFSSIVDFILAKKIHESENQKTRKTFLIISLSVNLGLLMFFKYFNFFIDSLVTSFTFFGGTLDAPSLSIILPVGISFYTFQTLSYTIDVFYKKLKPTNDPVAFFAFVSFFPQLVAGPIERAKNLLPQFSVPRKLLFRNFRFGIYLIIFGLFKKIIIGDTLAGVIERGFENIDGYNYGTLILVAFLFSIQIYVDFSGYTDIARGTARLFGFRLMENFRFPYFAQSIGRFWRHWHISLSTWFRDYVFIPLGGSRGTKLLTNRNLMIVFLVSGFWHGANWTYIVWGGIHGLVLIFENIFKNAKFFTEENFFLQGIRILYVNIIVVICWVFFRAEQVGDAFQYLGNIFSLQGGQGVRHLFTSMNAYSMISIALAIITLFASDFYYKKVALRKIYTSKIPYALCFVYILFLAFTYQETKQAFIYFQF